MGACYGLSLSEKAYCGLNFPAAVEMLADTLQHLKDTFSPQRQPLTLIAHDWGATYSYQVLQRRPELLRRYCAMDIGSVWNPQCKECCMVCSFQVPTASAFLCGLIPCVGKMFGNCCMRCMTRVTGGPLRDSYPGVSGMGYPQFFFWKRYVCGGWTDLMNPDVPRGNAGFTFLFLYA